ncbi:MAG TPA: hypothetical protein VF784_14645 [Anaerolineales bacterium]
MKKLALLVLAGILLTACQPPATPQPAAAPPTSVPETESPAPTPTAALVESPARSVSDLVGIWIFTIKLQFRADGTTRLYVGEDDGPQVVDEGSYTFDAGKLTFTTTSACKEPATYEAHVTRQDGKPVWLRLQVVGNDRCTGRADILSRAGKFYKP